MHWASSFFLFFDFLSSYTSMCIYKWKIQLCVHIYFRHVRWNHAYLFLLNKRNQSDFLSFIFLLVFPNYLSLITHEFVDLKFHQDWLEKSINNHPLFFFFLFDIKWYHIISSVAVDIDHHLVISFIFIFILILIFTLIILYRIICCFTSISIDVIEEDIFVIFVSFHFVGR